MSELKYFEPDKAQEVIGNRRVDDKLSARLRDMTGDELPDGPFGELPCGSVPAVRAEYLARPTVGDMDYLKTAREAGFEPWTLTYEMDQYLDSNPKKANMCRPRLALPKGQLVKLRVNPAPKRLNGAPIGMIPTEFGVNLGDWWLALRRYELSNNGQAGDIDNVSDISQWYSAQAAKNGWNGRDPSRASYYYPSLMGLYATRAVLFCDFDAFPNFTYAADASTRVEEELGVEPVIVKWRTDSRYPSKADETRSLDEASVDLFDEAGLCFDNLNQWLREEVKCVASQE